MPDTGAPFYLPYPSAGDLADFQPAIQNLAQDTDTANDIPWPRMYRAKSTRQDFAAVSQYTTIIFENESTLNPSTPGISYNAGIFTVDQAGVYQVNACVHCSIISGTPTIALRCRTGPDVSGTNGVVNASMSMGAQQASTAVIITKGWRMAAGDSLLIEGYFNSGVGSNYFYGSTSGPYSFIEIHMIAL